MSKLTITAFAAGCFILTATSIEAQYQTAPKAPAAQANGKSTFRPNMTKRPIQGMTIGTGKGGATTGQMPMNGANNGAMNPYGMNAYGANPYGQNGMSPYGMNPYGMTNPYGMSPYGMNPYGMTNPYGMMNPYGGMNPFFRGF